MRNNPQIRATNPSPEQLSIVIVPDLAIPHAYDDAVKGVDYVIHVAFPASTGGDMTQQEYEKHFIEGGIQGTVGMLQSAAKEESIKRVVITSSIAAIMPFQEMLSGSDRLVTAEDRIEVYPGPYQAEFEANCAAKAAALNEGEKWMNENKPGFDIVHIHPSFVEGRNDLAETPEDAFIGTNRIVLAIATGKEGRAPALPGASTHNGDVARLHDEALNLKIPAGSYISNWSDDSSNGTKWETVNEYVVKNFPDEVKSELLPNTGKVATIPIKFDSTKTDKTFGWRHQSLEEQVKSVVGRYLEILSKT